jgi:hypothetical protein
MLSQLRRTLVDSYVGAIGLGWLLADIVVNFAKVFTSPLAKWFVRREYGSLLEHQSAPRGFSLEDAVPDLVSFLVLLIVWYILMRWLYFKPIEPVLAEPE